MPCTPLSLAKNVMRIFHPEFYLLTKCKHGLCGYDGEDGRPGSGGVGGKHGLDKAWATQSAWWFDKWEKYSGHLIDQSHDTWFKRGHTIKKKSARPDGIRGENGKKNSAKSKNESKSNNKIKPQQISTAQISACRERIQRNNFEGVELAQKQLRELNDTLSESKLHTERLQKDEEKCSDTVKTEKTKLLSTKQASIENTAKCEEAKRLAIAWKEGAEKHQQFCQDFKSKLEIEFKLKQNTLAVQSIVVSNQFHQYKPNANNSTYPSKPSFPLESQLACSVKDPALTEFTNKIILELGHKTPLCLSFGKCVQNLLTAGLGVPDSCRTVLSKLLLEKPNAKVIGCHSLSKFVGKVFPSDCQNLTTVDENFKNMLMEVFTMKQPTNLYEMVLQLHTTVLSEALIKRLLIETESRYMPDNSGIGVTLRDILEVRLKDVFAEKCVEAFKKTVRIGSTDSQTFLHSIRSKSSDLWQKTKDRLPKLNCKEKIEDMSEFDTDLLIFFSKILEQIIPTFRKFCNIEIPTSYRVDIIQCLDSLVASLDTNELDKNEIPVLLEKVLLHLSQQTKGSLINSLSNIKEKEHLVPRLKFVLEQVEFDVEQLNQIYEHANNIVLERPQKALTVGEDLLRWSTELYLKRFQQNKINAINTIIIKQSKTLSLKSDDFTLIVEMVEAPESTLSFKERIEFFSKCLDILENNSNGLQNHIEEKKTKLVQYKWEIVSKLAKSKPNSELGDILADIEINRECSSKFLHNLYLSLNYLNFNLRYVKYPRKTLSSISLQINRIFSTLHQLNLLLPGGKETNSKIKNNLKISLKTCWENHCKEVISNFRDKYNHNSAQKAKSEMLEFIKRVVDENGEIIVKSCEIMSVFSLKLEKLEIMAVACGDIKKFTQLKEKLENFLQNYPSALEFLQKCNGLLETELKQQPLQSGSFKSLDEFWKFFDNWFTKNQHNKSPDFKFLSQLKLRLIALFKNSAVEYILSGNDAEEIPITKKYDGWLSKVKHFNRDVIKWRPSNTSFKDEVKKIVKQVEACHNNEIEAIRTSLLEQKNDMYTILDAKTQILTESMYKNLKQFQSIETLESYCLEDSYLSKIENAMSKLNILLNNEPRNTEEICVLRVCFECFEKLADFPLKINNMESKLDFIVNKILGLSDSSDLQDLIRLFIKTSPLFLERCFCKMIAQNKEIPQDVLLQLEESISFNLSLLLKTFEDVFLYEYIHFGIKYLDSNLRQCPIERMKILVELQQYISDTQGITKEGIWKFLSEKLMSQSNTTLRNIFFLPNTTTESRDLIRRSYLNTKSEFILTYDISIQENLDEKIIEILLKDESEALGLLTVDERLLWEHANSMNAKLSFPLDKMKETPPSKWLELVFEWQLLTSLMTKLNPIEKEEDKHILSDALESWRAVVSRETENHQLWLKNLETLIMAVAEMSISLAKLSSIFQNASFIPLNDLNYIIKNRLTEDWLEAILMKRIVLQLQNAFNDGNITNQIIQILQKIMTSEKMVNKKQLCEQFLDMIVEKIPRDKNHVVDLITLHHSFKSLEKLPLDSRLIQSLQCEGLHQWLGYIRRFEYEQKGLTNVEIELALQVESKYKETTEKFVDLMLKQFISESSKEKHTGILEILLTLIKNGDIVLDSQIMTITESDKPLETLIERLKEYTRNIPDLHGDMLVDRFKDLTMNNEFEVEQMRLQLKNVKQKQNERSCLLTSCELRIAQWKTEHVKAWSRAVKEFAKENKGNLYSKHTDEMLSVICRAIYLFTSMLSKKPYSPRDTQLASVLLFLDGVNENLGRFGEIATSEGKSDISAILAICLALGHNKVDIITSSPVLAKNGADHFKGLFDLFDISVGNNCDDSCRTGSASEDNLRERYRNLVIYGDVSSFETDLLYKEHMGKIYTHDRVADYIIVDEVDSMLLDKGSHVLYISHIIPELKQLRKIFLDIWKQVKFHSNDEEKIIVLQHFQKLFSESKTNFPQFLTNFVRKRIPLWVDNAYGALNMEQNEPYVVSNKSSHEGLNKVTIVDLDTGVEQANMQYSYGLHQFLQLKHGNKLSLESLKAVFISNVAYFQRFERKIFGITGTMGSEAGRKLMADLYKVKFFKMPRYKLKNCTKENGIVCSDNKSHLDELIKSTESRILKQPTLIICPNVKSALEIFKYLNGDKNERQRIFLYRSANDDSKFHATFNDKSPLKAGDVIVSTNLAGRGTDLEIDPNCCEGLHVILSYLPPNERVEKQAFGRTARAGKKGSTQYIIVGEIDTPIEEYRKTLEDLANERLSQIKNKQIPRIQLEEILLKDFKRKMDWVKQHVINNTSERVKTKILTLITNHWAFWLDGIQDQLPLIGITKDEHIYDSFKMFWKDEEADLKAEIFCKSPAEFIKLSRAFYEDGNFDKAVTLLEESLKIESNFNEIAHYHLGIALIRMDSIRKTQRRRRDVYVHFKMARKKMLKQIDLLMNMQLELQCTQDPPNSVTNTEETSQGQQISFFQQMNNEKTILQSHLYVIDEIIGQHINKNYFCDLPMVHLDEMESAAILGCLILCQDLERPLLSPPRLAKHLTVDEKGNIRLNYQPLEIEENMEMSIDWTVIQDILRRKIKLSAHCAYPVTVEANDFIEAVVTKEVFWKRMVDIGFVTDIKRLERYIIHYNDDTFQSISDISSERKPVFARILKEQNLQTFSLNTTFHELENKDDLAFVEHILKVKGIIIKQTNYCGIIPYEYHSKLTLNKENQLEGFPTSLNTYRFILKTWLVQNTKNGPHIINDILDTNNMPTLLDNSTINSQAEDVYNELVRIGCVKLHKVKWSLSQNYDKEDNATKEIKNLFTPKSRIDMGLQKVFHQFHPDASQKEFSEYTASIRDSLLHSVGKYKTVNKLKIEEDSILKDFSDKISYHSELTEFIMEDFERIPKVSEKIPWWNSGATWVAALGILQIGLGVALGVISGGTLANLSMILISEGGSDIMFAAHSGSTGNFSWQSYGIQKAFSVAASVFTGGLAGTTGASLVTRIGMEVVEEIVKKVVWTVGRYAAQGLLSTGLGMTIEKVLDRIRTWIVTHCSSAWQAFIKSDSKFNNATGELNKILQDLYSSSYRPGQSELIMKQSIDCMINIGEASSPYRHGLQAAVGRVTHFCTEKFATAMGKVLGKNVVCSLSKLHSLIKKAIATKCDYIKLIKDFALNHIQRLCTYFKNEKKKLDERVQQYVTKTEKSSKENFDISKAGYLSNLNKIILNDGLVQLQEGFAEPALKTLGNRVIDKICSKMFENKQANFSKTFYTEENGWFCKDLYRKPNKHYAVDMNTSDGRVKRRQNNIWSTIDRQAFVYNAKKSVGELVSMFGENSLHIYEIVAGKPYAIFMYTKINKNQLNLAIANGIPVVRRIDLP